MIPTISNLPGRCTRNFLGGLWGLPKIRDTRYSEIKVAERPEYLSTEELLARGRLDAAAEAFEGSGDLSRARDLFERVGNFERAARIAAMQGDLLAELRLTLRIEPPLDRRALLERVRQAERSTQEQAAQICEQQRAWREAAAIHLALQQDEAAHRLFLRAHDYVNAATIDEKRGQLRAAIALYRLALQAYATAGPDRGATFRREDAVAAHHRCARLLLRIGQAEEAIPQLQRARMLLQGAADVVGRAERADIEAALMECFVALDERGLAEHLFAQHLTWWEPAKSAPSVIDYLRVRAQPDAAAEGRPAALVLGRYRLGRFLGTGSVGRVYEAEDLYSDRRVALKLLALVAAGSPRAAALYERFCREATLLSALRHPKLVRVESFHASAGVLALELMEGGAVSDAALPLSLATLRRLLLDVLDALMCMHAASVLHRDVKPHNIFLDRFGGAKLGDFGIASLRDLGVTQTEGLVGTLAYMAPEQIRGSRLSTATDVYGLGVTAFQLATGRLPFPGPDLLAQHVESPPPDPRQVQPLLPDAWAGLLLRLLAKDPEQRSHGLDALRAEVARLPVGPLDVQDAGRLPSSPSVESSALAREVTDVATDAATDGLGSQGSETCIAATPHSQIFVALDARAGRTVLIERFAPGLLQSSAGAHHMVWLRRMAALAGPGLQRIYHVDLAPSPPRLSARSGLVPHGDGPAAEVVFQYFDPAATTTVSALLPDERALVSRVLQRLRGAGVVHGSPGRALVRATGHVSLLLCGQGPLSGSGGVIDSGSGPLPPAERLDD